MSLWGKREKEKDDIVGDEGGLGGHPLVMDAKRTFTKRIWSEWRGGLSACFITAVTILSLPEDFLNYYILPLRFELVRLMVPITCFGVMFAANWTEHVLQPPVEPKGIVSFSGKSVFFTVNVIGILLVYYTLSLVGQFCRIYGYENEILTYVTYRFFVHVYSLGMMLSLFYYAGVLGDADERENINRWHLRGVPLARYLHTTHGSSLLCVNLDLIFKNRDLVCSFLPTQEFIILSLHGFGTYYTIWVMLNYSITGYFPYPFMNGMGNPGLCFCFLCIMGGVGACIGVCSSMLISLVKCDEVIEVFKVANLYAIVFGGGGAGGGG
ncbi:hypothetical protein TrRE_jg9210 [Triparma retinervis]|uniref:Uncharacterized protein n=1 Tax=Triparma retinervis TaxID=2557542 RepID=A0A9W6ZK99_9STRA|nr:hypothetical protein TrRE_jg9210 [Triparma retinervis]